MVPEREVAGLFLVLGRSVQPAPAGQRRLQGILIKKTSQFENEYSSVADPDISGSVRILLFLSLTNKKVKKQFCFRSFSAYYFLKGINNSFFKDKKSKRSHKTAGIKVFLTIFA